MSSRSPHALPANILLSNPSTAQPVSTATHPSRNSSRSPFRYVQFHDAVPREKESEMPLSDLVSSPRLMRSGYLNSSIPSPPYRARDFDPRISTTPPHSSSRPLFPPPPRATSTSSPRPPHLYRALGCTLVEPQHASQSSVRPPIFWILSRIKPWVPIGAWVFTSLGFLLAISFFKTEVFQGLDDLSTWLQSQGYQGQAILFSLIFLTTFPPLPLYSTLIILSGYSFGPWTGAVISYFAALSGAVIVFLLSRAYLRNSITRLLSQSLSTKRVVRAIEKRPKLLFLIRLAPYPYNVMNVLLASSSLSLQTYTVCTALSLFKVIVHTMIGSSIHSFAGYHIDEQNRTPNAGDDELSSADGEEPSKGRGLGNLWTIFGIGLCICIFVYLSYVARRAVDDELEDDCCGAPMPASGGGGGGGPVVLPLVSERDARQPFLPATSSPHSDGSHYAMHEDDGEATRIMMAESSLQSSSDHAAGRWSPIGRFLTSSREERNVGLGNA